MAGVSLVGGISQLVQGQLTRGQSPVTQIFKSICKYSSKLF